MPDDGRPDPDALLASLPAETARGKLKIFLGAAPGVGKTWEMLNQARRRAAEFPSVLAGIIETHGRAETQAQIADLAILPRRPVAYRGQTLEEFDLDAALAAHPALLLVDELAHTNAPGSRHNKRWEDVAELLEAGITVWATLNVQHLESLNDDVARITGVRPAETLPDHVLELADEIELIDVPPAELRQRLADGRIYRPDTARRALDGFFKEGNLLALREIALRRAAAHVDSDVQAWLRRSGVSGPFPSAERVIALLGPDASAESVLRQAKRLADALHAPWIALHIERPRADSHAGRVPLTLAAQLGAEIEVRALEGDDLAGAVLAAARARNATHIVIGRSPGASLRRLLGRTLSNRLLRGGPEFALHVIPVPNTPRRHARPPRAQPWRAYAASLAAIALVTAIGVQFRALLPGEAADMIYLAVVVAIAGAWGTAPALLAAGAGLLAWDYCFLPPLYRFTIDSPRDLVSAVVFLFAALLTGSLAGRVRREVGAAGARIDSLRRIAAFSRKLGEPTTEPDLLAEVARQAATPARPAVVLTGSDTLRIAAAEPPATTLDEGAMAAAQWSFSHAEPTGRGTATLPSTQWRFLPLRTLREKLGVLAIRPEADLDEPQLQALDALADQAAVALERVRLANASARAAALEETQQLRTALLASLGHDLRTPLAGIQGAAGTLRATWPSLPDPAREDLLGAIEDDVRRMTHFLANITDLTRLESGEIRARLAPLRLAEIAEAALARLPNALYVATDIPPTLAVSADPALLEQVLFNVLDNAAKYAPPQSTVRLSATAHAGRAIIAIADSGVGIPPDDLAHVFDSFYRVHRRDRGAAGIGLGLAIAHGLMTAMAGTIAARSPNPESPRGGLPGTVITLDLPLASRPPGAA